MTMSANGGGSPMGWYAVGTGKQMSGSNMMVSCLEAPCEHGAALEPHIHHTCNKASLLTPRITSDHICSSLLPAIVDRMG